MVLVTPSPDGGEVAADGTKKKKLTSLEKSDGRRLVEYLVVVRSVPRDDDSGAEKGELNLSTSFDDEDVEVLRGFKPLITARYPLFDHEDNPLHENVTFFCHPSGSIQLKKERHMPKVRIPEDIVRTYRVARCLIIPLLDPLFCGNGRHR